MGARRWFKRQQPNSDIGANVKWLVPEEFEQAGESTVLIPDGFPHAVSSRELTELATTFARAMRFHALKNEGAWVQMYGVLYDTARGELNRRDLRRSAWVSSAALCAAVAALGVTIWSIQSDKSDEQVRQLRQDVVRAAHREQSLLQQLAYQNALDARHQHALLRSIRQALGSARGGRTLPQSR